MVLAECLALSKVLEIELAKQQPDTQPVDDLVGDIRCGDYCLNPPCAALLAVMRVCFRSRAR